MKTKKKSPTKSQMTNQVDSKTKKMIRSLILSQLIVSSAIPAFAAHQIAIGVKNADSELQEFLMQNPIEKLPTHSGKYSNDNSYVQLYHPKYNPSRISVINKDTHIVLPAQLTYDELMDFLLKVRAARTFGASQVFVSSKIPLKNITLPIELKGMLDLEELIAAAGADLVSEAGIARPIQDSKPKKNLVSQPSYLLGGSSHSFLLGKVAQKLSQTRYSFEAIAATPPDALIGKKIYWFAALTPPANSGDPSINQQLFTTLAQIRWMEQRGAVVHLVSPYLPYARSDKPEFDVGVTTQGRLVADLIEAVGTQGITVVRAHAPQSLGFFKIHSREVAGRKTIIQTLKNNEVDCIVAPDAGFQKDATKYQHELNSAYEKSIPRKNVCLVVMNKQRDFAGNETILGATGLEQIKGKNIVIVDDETSTGGTLHGVAEYIQKSGNAPHTTFAVVTHLAGNAKHALNSEYIERLIVTNTVPVNVESKKLEIVSIEDEIAEDIQEIELQR